jgi:uncharacterized OsmC-like protein
MFRLQQYFSLIKSLTENWCQEEKDEKIIPIIGFDILLLSPVEEEKKLLVQEIASQCPISKILGNQIKVRTSVFRDDEAAGARTIFD